MAVEREKCECLCVVFYLCGFVGKEGNGSVSFEFSGGDSRSKCVELKRVL